MVLALLLILGYCCHGILTTAGCSSTSICSHCHCRGDDLEEENEEEEETTALTVNPYRFFAATSSLSHRPRQRQGSSGSKSSGVVASGKEAWWLRRLTPKGFEGFGFKAWYGLGAIRRGVSGRWATRGFRFHHVLDLSELEISWPIDLRSNLLHTYSRHAAMHHARDRV